MVVFLSILLTINISAQKTELKGKAPKYAGEELTFYTYSDYITRDTLQLASARVDKDGFFSCILKLEEIRKIYTDLGVYKGYLYVDPGKEYELVLPEKKEKNKAQKLNPYFKGVPVHIGIKNSSPEELNYQINVFSSQYDKIINKNANNIKNLSQIRDSIYTLLDSTVQSDNPYFQNYKKYKLGGLKVSLGYPANKIKKELLANEKVLYNNPAYMDLVSTLYQDYFKDMFSKYGYKIYYIINQLKSYPKLDSLVREDWILNDNDKLRGLILLKNLHDAFYDKSFSRKAVIQIIDSMQQAINHTENLRIAGNIKEKNQVLEVGDQAPPFCLYNKDSNQLCLEDLKGEYIYLGFCNSLNYSCIKHYSIMENLYKKHKKHFKIVIISNADKFSQMKRFVEHHGYPWTFLHLGNNQKLMNDYNVKNMPAYFFINPEGKLVLAPAPMPSENIEERIYRVMKREGAL
jgi:peroxiredoxin